MLKYLPYFSGVSFSKFGVLYFNNTLALKTKNCDTQVKLLMVHSFLPTKMVGRQVWKLHKTCINKHQISVNHKLNIYNLKMEQPQQSRNCIFKSSEMLLMMINAGFSPLRNLLIIRCPANKLGLHLVCCQGYHSPSFFPGLVLVFFRYKMTSGRIFLEGQIVWACSQWSSHER